MQALVLVLFLTGIGSGVWAEHATGFENNSVFCSSPGHCQDEDAALKSVFLQEKHFISQDLAPPTIHSHVQLNQHTRSAYKFEAESSKSQESGGNHMSAQRDHRKPFFWIHLHKAAGSSICVLSQENGEVLPVPNGNCNWRPDSNHKWLRMPAEQTPANCSQRLNLLIETRFTWSQIERPFDHNSMFCPPSFGYATALRDPIQSLESMLNFFDPFEPFNLLGRQQDVQCFLRGITESCPDNLSSAEDSLWIYFDNPMVRLLGGPEIMELPFGRVNSTHSDKVLELLSMFDLVVCAEELSSNATRNKFRTLLGWNRTATDHQNPSQKTLFLTDADEEVARNLNAHDYNIYNRFCQF